jgi:hypothetical protein
MNTPTLESINTDTVASCVRAYLLARVFAETKRAQIDAIKQDILSTAVYNSDDSVDCLRGQRVTSPGEDWTMAPEEFADYIAEVNKRAREQGVKPDDMPDSHCPALVAEHLQVYTENLLIEESGKPFGVTNDGLLCCQGGLEKRQRWIDLVVGLVLKARPEISAESLLKI